MLAMLESPGIEKDQPFAPDESGYFDQTYPLQDIQLAE